jgi:flap endonuclease-1
MGVSLTELINPREIEFQDLQGRTIAIDAHNTLYQFLSIIRDRLTGEPLRDSKGRVTSHLSGLFYRTSRMLESGIKPIFVFDGKPPDFKRDTVEIRKGIRRDAEVKWKQAVEKGEVEKVRLYAQGATKLTDDMISDAKTILDLMGIPWIDAPSEGEAQAAYLVRKGHVWASGSQDWDSLLFSAERLVRNLTVSGRRKLPRRESYVTVRPEIIELKDVLSSLGINQEQLICLGILVGTDYDPGGVKGIGPKNALKLVKEKKTCEKVFRGLVWEFKPKPEDILRFFENPPVRDIEIPESRPDHEKLENILVEEYEFSKDRIGNTLRKLKEAEEKGKQSRLGSFFGK